MYDRNRFLLNCALSLYFHGWTAAFLLWYLNTYLSTSLDQPPPTWPLSLGIPRYCGTLWWRGSCGLRGHTCSPARPIGRQYYFSEDSLCLFLAPSLYSLELGGDGGFFRGPGNLLNLRILQAVISGLANMNGMRRSQRFRRNPSTSRM